MSRCRSNNAMKVCALAALAVSSSAAWGQLRIVTMNTTNFDATRTGPQPGMDLILSALGSTVADDPNMPGNTGITKAPDVVAIQESNGWQTTGVQYRDLLRTLYPGVNYQVVQLNGASNGSGTQNLVYNAGALQLISGVAVGTTSGSGMPRQVPRYQFRPVGYGSDADFYIYNFHTKAGPEPENVDRRGVEGDIVRANANALPANSNIVYLGDFNVYSAAEPFYVKMTAAGTTAQAIDPIDKDGTPSSPANWNSNSAYKNVHTQSPFSQATADALGTGFSGATGGMDDRLDFQLMTANLLDGHGVAYIPNSYQAFGNNGTHQYNQPIDYAVNGNIVNQAQPANVLRALASIMDHVPVVADYQLPAKMSVTVSAAPAKVIVGTPVSVDVGVTNSAPVQYAIGADVLAYAVTGTGLLTGSASGTRAALAGAATHTLTLLTGTAGAKSGAASVTSSSQQVAGGSFSQAVTYTVVDHANGTLGAATADVNAKTIDFGYVPQGFASRTAAFTIGNVAAASGFTADLALNSVSASGSASMATNVAPFARLAAGSQNSYTATLSTGTSGALTTTHTYDVSDEAIPGAAANAPLVLTTTARVISSATFPATGFIQLNGGETYDTGPFSIAGGVTLTKTGPGAMNVTGLQANGAGSTLIVNGGIVRMSTDAAGLAVSVANTGTTVQFDATQHIASLGVVGATASVTAGAGAVLTMKSLGIVGGKLDLNDNDAIVDYDGASPAGTLVAYLLSGRAGGAWTGNGIMSTSAAANAQQTTAIGWAEASVLGTAAFDGESLDGSAVLLKYTYYGDTDLDGRVTADDFARADRGLAKGLTGWVNGDFDYSGTINAADFLLMDRAFAQQNGGVLSPAFLASREAAFGGGYVDELIASVPEPGTGLAGVASLAVIVGGRRARRMQKQLGKAPV